MMNKSTLLQERIQFQEARAFIEQRGILPESEGYTTRQLAGELSRRGWRWDFGPEGATASKAYPASPSSDQAIIAEGPDPIASLVLVLARAIRFDEEHGLSVARPFRVDIIAQASDGSAVAIIEVKNREGLTHDLAATLRRNLLVHGLGGLRTPYFMFVSQEVGFLWDQRDELRPDAPPTSAFSMQPVMERYAPWLKAGERLGGAQLELIVAAWLNHLASDYTGSTQPLKDELEGTGFLDVLKGTMILMDSQV